MFQRLKGNLDSFLDSKIAEEQARQKGQSGTSSPVKRTPSSAARRGVSRTESPNRPANRARADSNRGIPAKGPDPSEFVIEDDEAPSRTATPNPAVIEASASSSDQSATATNETEPAQSDAPVTDKAQGGGKQPEELPQDVRQKLRKLEKLESRYTELLRSYRIAHARVTAIEPFEAALRENTPLTSIADPSALVEYLMQLNLKGDMVMEEYKKVTGEKDDIKRKLDDAEKRTKDAFDEAAGLRKERDEKNKATTETDPLGAVTLSVDDKDSKSTRKSEDFFSYEEEAPRLQEELDQKTRQVEELNEKITTLETDLEAAQNAGQKARDELEKATKDQSTAKESQDKSDSDSEKKVAVLEEQKSVLEKQKLESEQKVSEFQKQTSELEKKYNDSEDAINKIRTQLSQVDNVSESDKKPLESRIKALGDKLSQASSDLKTANSQIEDFKAKATSAQDALNKLEKESKDKAGQDASTKKASDADKKRLETLDSLVKTLKSQLADAESTKKSLQKDMDSMRNDLKKSENGLKAAAEAASVVSTQDTSLTALRGQLKAAERERDDAYQMILACGHCKVPEQEASEVVVAESTSTATPDTALPAQGAESGAAKKKNKNKKKKKGGAAATNKPAEASESAPPSSAPSPKPEEKSEETPTLQESVLSPEQLSAARAHILNSLGQLAPGRNVNSEDSSEKITELKTVIEKKDAEIKNLTTQIEKKEAAIDRLDAKLKGEEDLKEEIDDLREQLKDIGNDLCGARDQIKTLKAQKDSDSGERAEEMKQLEDRCKSLQKQCDDLKSEIKSKTEVQAKVQKELDELKQSSGSSSKELESKLAAIQKQKEILETTNKKLEKEAESLKSSHKDSSEKHKSLAAEFDEHKSTTSSLRTDLSAANELAQTRYKDLTALREHLNKIQPELTSLRQEATELKKAKEDLTASNGTLRKLEAKEKDLQSEISSYKTQAKEKDAEIKSLNDKVKQNAERTATLEEQTTRSQKDLQRAEKSQKEATESRDKLQKDLTKAQEESSKQREELQNLEKQVSTLTQESGRLKEELQLKSAQQASAQSLMDSMQDQTRELATQMKEVKERCESLEEELADAHRLLSERSREAETMRRLLADVEGRAESRVKEMRERMDVAIEERDRAEEEASTAGRRRARELEDLKHKLRDAEQQLSSINDEKEDFEKKETAWRKQKVELEKKADAANEELTEVRSAMTQLRDALDDHERTSHSLEKEKTDLRKTLFDTETRLASLQKSSKALADEIKTLKGRTSQPSARSSLESSRIGSPMGSRNGSVATTGGPDAKGESVDYVYLKNVLLQFLEQKDRKHQLQLVPVLGMLLHFDKCVSAMLRAEDKSDPWVRSARALCEMPAVPWVLDCASPDVTDSFMVIDKVNRDRISDAVIALTENTEDIFQAYTLVNQVMHDHRVLADQLPLDASSGYIEGLALLKVHIAAYDVDLDLTLRWIPRISARLRDLHSDEQPWTENIFELIAPWINARTKWGSFHCDMVHHLRDWATEFTNLYSRSKRLLSTCETVSITMKSLKAEADQATSAKTAKSWRSLGKAPEHTTGTIKTSEDLITAIEEAFRLLNTTHNAAKTGLASMQAAERHIEANGPTWKKYLGKRAEHITNTLADLKEVSKLASELRAHRKTLRDAVEIVPGGGKLYTPDITSTALVTSYAKLPKRRWYSSWVDLIRDSPLVMFQRNVAFAFQEWATSLGDLRRKLEILIKTCDVMHEQTKVLNIEATEGLGSENKQQGFWMYQFNIPLTSEQSASANLIRKYKNILKVIEKASPLLVTTKGNVDSALAAIESAHDRATADLLGVFSPRGATSVDIRLEAVLEDLKITMRDARVARIHRAEIRASIESGP
ncbi:hypothetical protein D6C92_06318 [Aureobasidium pullulans]|nr:hypothetical protein D6C92_06318 [Aureobasidium pullulans]